MHAAWCDVARLQGLHLTDNTASLPGALYCIICRLTTVTQNTRTFCIGIGICRVFVIVFRQVLSLPHVLYECRSSLVAACGLRTLGGVDTSRVAVRLLSPLFRTGLAWLPWLRYGCYGYCATAVSGRRDALKVQLERVENVSLSSSWRSCIRLKLFGAEETKPT